MTDCKKLNQVVVVTGASSGIGKETAILLSKYYERIAIVGYRRASELEDTKDQILKNGSDCLLYKGDLGDASFVNNMMDDILATWGRIDILINNAGRSHVGLLSDMTDLEWNDLLASNLSSAFYTCRKAIPNMVHNQSGRILNISSVWGEVGASCEVAYSATKGGINAYTKALAKELAPSNIAVNAISFGAIDTSMNACFTKDELDDLADEIPFGRLGTTKEAAEMILHIIKSPIYLTGQIIRMDGGWI